MYITAQGCRLRNDILYCVEWYVKQLYHTIHSVTQLTLQCAANTSSSFAFLQLVVVDGIPLFSCTVYIDIFVEIFLNDISPRG